MTQPRETRTDAVWTSMQRTSCEFAVIETSKEDERRREQATPEDVVMEIERHMPDGAGPTGREYRWLPYVMGTLAVVGISMVAATLGMAEGWRAGLLGGGAVLTGCAVSWIVVWGAGVMRAREQRAITHVVEEHVVEPMGRVRCAIDGTTP